MSYKITDHKNFDDEVDISRLARALEIDTQVHRMGEPYEPKYTVQGSPYKQSFNPDLSYNISHDKSEVQVEIDFVPINGTYDCDRNTLDEFKKETVNKLLKFAKKTLDAEKRKTVNVKLIENNIKIQEYTFSAV